MQSISFETLETKDLFIKQNPNIVLLAQPGNVYFIIDVDTVNIFQ